MTLERFVGISIVLVIVISFVVDWCIARIIKCIRARSKRRKRA